MEYKEGDKLRLTEDKELLLDTFVPVVLAGAEVVITHVISDSKFYVWLIKEDSSFVVRREHLIPRTITDWRKELLT